MLVFPNLSSLGPLLPACNWTYTNITKCSSENMSKPMSNMKIALKTYYPLRFVPLEMNNLGTILKLNYRVCPQLKKMDPPSYA